MFARDRGVKELARVEAAISDGRVTIKDALTYVFVLGSECAREDAMHRACLGFSEARAERETMMRLFLTSPPPVPRP